MSASRTAGTRTHVLRTLALLGVAVVATLVPSGAAHAHPGARTPPAPALLFTSDRDGDTEIVLRATNGSLRQLTRNRVQDFGAVWSPDMRRIASSATVTATTRPSR